MSKDIKEPNRETDENFDDDFPIDGPGDVVPDDEDFDGYPSDEPK